jgi:hypothetical protein
MLPGDNGTKWVWFLIKTSPEDVLELASELYVRSEVINVQAAKGDFNLLVAVVGTADQVAALQGELEDRATVQELKVCEVVAIRGEKPWP